MWLVDFSVVRIGLGLGGNFPNPPTLVSYSVVIVLCGVTNNSKTLKESFKPLETSRVKTLFVYSQSKRRQFEWW
jgi:hypothetical protein